MKKTLLVCMLWPASVAVVNADPWIGEGELGFVEISGNTNSKTLTAKGKFEKVHNSWKHIAKANAIQSSNDDLVQSESYSAGWRSEYDFTERAFGFGDIRYFDDKFDSFTGIYTGAVGAGYRIFNREDDLTWEVSIGAGYRATDEILLVNPPDPTPYTEEDVSSTTYLLESDYDWHITGNTRLENYTRVEVAADNTFSQNVTGFSVNINSTLALKLGYDIRHNSDPSPGFESTDRISTVTIVFSF